MLEFVAWWRILGRPNRNTNPTEVLLKYFYNAPGINQSQGITSLGITSAIIRYHQVESMTVPRWYQLSHNICYNFPEALERQNLVVEEQPSPWQSPVLDKLLRVLFEICLVSTPLSSFAASLTLSVPKVAIPIL
ncbi:hypothetical protein QYM36_004221 [Artemia franciscana]|uniref:Uncharacterized protein n=1 Tax=Artemia franciscana TaxID=6661 RepID=A0AA88HZT7_ARTSF|nr:hypothetical protein QYM36_004221 [Artemia franciscana]